MENALRRASGQAHRRRRQPLLGWCIDKAKSVRTGDPFDPATELGPARVSGGEEGVLVQPTDGAAARLSGPVPLTRR